MIITQFQKPIEWRWPHFTLEEFVCKCGKQGAFSAQCKIVLIDEDLLDFLEQLRSALGGYPIHITSGYRCPEQNQRARGVIDSQHLLGKAADIKVRELSAAQVQDVAEALLGDRGGLGRYKSFTHIDVRGYRARW